MLVDCQPTPKLVAIKKSNIRYLANILLQIDHTKRKDLNIYFSEVGRQMFLILLVDQDRETSVLPSGRRAGGTGKKAVMHSLTHTSGLFAPRGPEEAGRTSVCSPRRERGFLPNCQGLCAVTKSWYRVVVAW